MSAYIIYTIYPILSIGYHIADLNVELEFQCRLGETVFTARCVKFQECANLTSDPTRSPYFKSLL